jgi:iron complex outermembrane receptor protein
MTLKAFVLAASALAGAPTLANAPDAAATRAPIDFVDIARVEVLRGPQGTLYGKNVTSGAIAISTRRPQFEPEGRAELSVGNLGFVQAQGWVTGRLIDDKLAASFAVIGTSRNGTLTNVDTGVKANAQDNTGFRGQLLWNLTDDICLTFAGDYSRQNPECCAQVWTRVAPTRRAANRQYPALAAAFDYAPPSTDPFDRLIDPDTFLQAKQSFGGTSAILEWDTGNGTLTSVSVWRFWDWQPSNDRDFLALPITTVSANPSQQKQITQEVRYNGSMSEKIDFVAGLFYFRQTIKSQGAGAGRGLFALASGADGREQSGPARRAAAGHDRRLSQHQCRRLRAAVVEAAAQPIDRSRHPPELGQEECRL